MSIADRNRIAALETKMQAMSGLRDQVGTLTSTLGQHGKKINKALNKLEASEATLEQVVLDVDKLRVEIGGEDS